MPFGVDDALMIGAGLAGAAGGFFGGGGGEGPQTQSMNQSTRWNQTQTTSPWAGVSPYMFGMPVGEDGKPQAGPAGVFPEAARLYGSTGWTPQMQAPVNNLLDAARSRAGIFNTAAVNDIAPDMLAGGYDPNITAAGPVVAGGVDLSRARAMQGELNPTRSLMDFLSGESVNPYVDKQGKAITDLLTRNMLETVMPNIRSGAIEAGQYGSNRQAQAEALAMSRLNTDLAPTIAGLGGSAYENERNRRFQAAMGLNDQAVDVATANTDREFDASKFNAQTALANNSQEMQRAAQVLGNRGAGLDFMAGAGTVQDQNYLDQLKGMNIQNDYGWGNLGRYETALNPAFGFTTTDGAGTSNTQGQTTTTGGGGGSGGGIAGAVGGAAAGLGLANSIFGPNGIYGGPRFPGNSPAGAAAPWGGVWSR